MPKNRALLIGINQYHPLIGPLGGCVNDLKQVRNILLDLGVCSLSEIRELADANATREAIFNSFDWLVEDAIEGDLRIIYYSGHGTRLPNANDPSGKDEALVVFSSEWESLFVGKDDASEIFLEENWDLQFIRDKEIKACLGEVPEGVNLTLIMDCCHSGNIQRDIQVFPRFLPPPSNIREEIEQAQHVCLENAQESMLEASLDTYKLDKNQMQHLIQKIFLGNRFDFVNTQEKNILLAACSEKETALEKMFEGRAGGVFTHYLVKVLRAQGENITYSGLMKSLGDHMRFFPQMPRLACSAHVRDQLIFSSLKNIS